MSKLYSVISHYILPMGFFFFLTGILYFNSFSAYHTQIYLFLIVPTFILLLGNWQSFSPILKSNAFKILLLLFGYAILSLLWNDPAISDFKYIKRLLIILLFILALISIGKDYPDKIVIGLLITACIYSAAAYYSFFIDYILGNKTLSSRIIGIGNLSNPLLSSHIYGIFTAFLMTYFFALNRNLKKDIGLIVLFFGLITFVILTGSRTPLVGLGSVLFLLLWIHRSKYLLYFFLALCGLAIIYFSINFDLLVQRGLSFRPEIWSITITKIAEKPVFGTGLGTDISIYIADLKTMFMDTHNIHLGLTYKLGILGLFLWVAFLISLFIIYLKNKTSLIAQMGIVLLTYGVSAGMTEGTSFFSRPKEVWFLIWLPIALLFVAEYGQLQANNLKKQDSNL